MPYEKAVQYIENRNPDFPRLSPRAIENAKRVSRVLFVTFSNIDDLPDLLWYSNVLHTKENVIVSICTPYRAFDFTCNSDGTFNYFEASRFKRDKEEIWKNEKSILLTDEEIIKRLKRNDDAH